jgi:meiotically up-regulated gene 157 (Mug157) protein
MIWSAFRPSDDPVRYPYNIPQQLFAAKELEDLAHLALVGYNDVGLAQRARTLAVAVRLGVERYGIVYDFRHGWMYAFEVDGLGRSLLVDDANLPNLLSLPFLNLIARDDPLYVNSRSFSLSSDNLYWYRGRYGDGLGSPHTRTGWVWPLGLVTEAMTSLTPEEVADCLAELRTLDGQRGLFYESIDPERPWRFTRGDFGWANALYAELIFRSVAWLDPPNASRPFPDLLSSAWQTPRITTATQAWDAAATIYTALREILSEG